MQCTLFALIVVEYAIGNHISPTTECFEEIATIIDYRVKHAMHRPDDWFNETTDRVFHGSLKMINQDNGKNFYLFHAPILTGWVTSFTIFLMSVLISIIDK